MKYFLFIIFLTAFVSCNKFETSICENGYLYENGNCEDINECTIGLHNCSNTDAICENTEGSFVCICKTGFSGNGKTCNDVDECVLGTHNCSTGFTCENTEGSFICEDIDECLNNTNNCNIKSICRNTAGSFTCTCKSGYSGNGVTCIDVDECENPVTCETGFSCENTIGFYNCIDVDECLNPSACETGFTCENTEGSFNCDDTNECINGTHNCSTGFICENIIGSFNCNDINECTNGTANCSNDEVCINTAGSFTCDIDECADNTDNCSSGFTCENTIGSFVCNDINECTNGTCSLNATCTNTISSFTCTCNSGYEGDGINCSEFCGNNISTISEECDGTDLVSETCVSLNYSAGDLTCKSTCEYKTSDCRLTKQWGTNYYDLGKSVAVDSSGNVFVTGWTTGGLDGNSNAGNSDIFLTKWNNVGVKQWTKQWGTANYDEGKSVAVDSSGNMFVTGWTIGGLDGNTNAGSYDIFLTKFDNSGTKQWTKQWGTNNRDIGNSVAVDSSGNVFVTGYAGSNLDSSGNSGVFLTKFDNNGIKQWTKQWGTTNTDYGNSVVVDSSGNVFITGDTSYGLDGNTNAGDIDIFLTKFNSTGIKQWTKQWGTTSENYSKSVAVDNSGNVFVTGYTVGELDVNTNAVSYDIFLTKFDNAGTKQWSKQWGTTNYDIDFPTPIEGNSVAVDGSGNVFVTGSTIGGLDGNTNAGELDIFLTKWNNAGVKQWTKQWGTTSNDNGYSVAVDNLGNVFVIGSTQSGLDGNTNAGGWVLDIFLTKFESE